MVKEGRVVPDTVLPISVTFDHRVFDGVQLGKTHRLLRQLFLAIECSCEHKHSPKAHLLSALPEPPPEPPSTLLLPPL